MSIPVTSRLDEVVVAALDHAVDAGLAESRSAAIADAVNEWLLRHGEEAIVASYRRRYATEDAPTTELLEALAAFSVAAALVDD